MTAHYTTTDIYLAAFLRYRAADYLGLERIGPKKVAFHFVATADLHDLLRLYWSCRLTPLAPAELFALLHDLRCASITRPGTDSPDTHDEP